MERIQSIWGHLNYFILKYWLINEFKRSIGPKQIEYSDPKRFKQKGYSPLIENKLRTKFTSELAKLEKEIVHESDAYLRNEGKEFTVDGQTFTAHAARKRAEFDKWRLECRKERVQSVYSSSICLNFLFLSKSTRLFWDTLTLQKWTIFGPFS